MYMYMSSFYVNKLIKAEAESFLKRFFLDYPILYIYIYILTVGRPVHPSAHTRKIFKSCTSRSSKNALPGSI